MYRELWNASIVLLILGGVAAAAGVCFRYYAAKLAPYRGFAEARVIAVKAVPRQGEASFSEYRNRLAAVFEFYADGRPVKVVDPTDQYPCPYRIGDRVQICYNPDNPSEYRIVRRNKWAALGTYCSLLSIVLVLTGCTLFLVYAGRIRLGA